MKLLRLLFLITALFGFSNSVQADERKPIKIISTFSIIDDLVKNAGAGNIERHVLVGRNGDAHTFEPTPKETVLLKEADIIFEIGLGFEPWLDDLYAASTSKARRVKLSDGIKLITSKDTDHDHDHSHDSQADPHIWHDPKNAIIMFQHITNALIDHDPSQKEFYLKWSKVYIEDLTLLDKMIQENLQMLPKDKRKLVTSHDTFGYFARAYGFELIGAAINSATTEATDPSAKNMAELIKSIKESKVKAIFAENTKNQKLLQVIADEANVKLAPPLYTDALGEIGSEGDSYMRMMTYNITTIVRNLSF